MVSYTVLASTASVAQIFFRVARERMQANSTTHSGKDSQNGAPCSCESSDEEAIFHQGLPSCSEFESEYKKRDLHAHTYQVAGGYIIASRRCEQGRCKAK